MEGVAGIRVLQGLEGVVQLSKDSISVFEVFRVSRRGGAARNKQEVEVRMDPVCC